MTCEVKANVAKTVLYTQKQRTAKASTLLAAWQQATLLSAAQNGGSELEKGKREEPERPRVIRWKRQVEL